MRYRIQLMAAESVEWYLCISPPPPRQSYSLRHPLTTGLMYIFSLPPSHTALPPSHVTDIRVILFPAQPIHILLVQTGQEILAARRRNPEQ